MTQTGKAESDPPVLRTILKEVAARTKRPEQWLSVAELELDESPEKIDAALRTLVERGWLSASQMTLHSVSITADGLKQLDQG